MTSVDTPVTAVLNLLGRRWMLRVIWELQQGPVGFRELRRRCDDMSSSVLSERLRELREANVMETGEDGVYRLTGLGRRLAETLLPLSGWARDWADTRSV
ncbi:winged helix-turn-helix transcriptional regulator [Amycolatopsis nigrescens]|uniref:winged helix-turn-helix transcriptional regulator n=1 Tax=Amycolatopsis nigrescens TaxID=381445 RepID=UPI0003A416B1|nr:helix-turn-helix domain-containing protein [Amycolatopsis nigrescens]